MRLREGVPVAITCAALLAGCGTSERDLVQAKVNQFASATAHHQYELLCTQVLAASLVAHLTDSGIPCRTAMRVGFGSVQDPVLSIGKVTIHGKTAVVTTITTAKGQEASLQDIDLISTAKGWRINALGH